MPIDNNSFIAIADVHLGLNLYNLPELGKDIEELFIRVCDLAIEKGVGYIIMVGDTFNDNKPTPDLIGFVASQVSRLNEKGIKIIGIAGDHDKPINNESWSKVCGIAPISSIDLFYGCDYIDSPAKIFEQLTLHASETVQWLFLHGQVPSLWRYCEEKKMLDFSNYDVFKYYPNLKGIILGDIHKPFEGTMIDKDREIFIGYCGSLGITKSDEIDNKIGLLYYDGQSLSRLKFPQLRDFIKLELKEDDTHITTVDYFKRLYQNSNVIKRPVFIVEFFADQLEKLKHLKPLYQIGYVRIKKKFKTLEKDGEIINIRSELGTKERIATVLKATCEDEETRTLLSELLDTEDPKLVLDKFKLSKLIS